MKKVTVVGAGFSGLASAYYLSRAGFSVTVVEASTRAGGLIDTLKTDDGLVETAANAFLNSALVEELFAAIGVEQVGVLPTARKRFIFRQGHLRRWPLGILSSLRVAWFGLRFMIARSLVAPRAGETVQRWSERVLGHEAAQYLVSAALQGIYAGDSSRMSARLIVGRFFGARRSSSRAPKIRGSVSAPEGMKQVIEALVHYLGERGVQFEFGRTFVLSEERPVVFATSPSAAAKILSRRELDQIEMNPVTTTTAFFSQSSGDGFGVLFAPIERRKALGVLKNDNIFPNRARQHAETWIQGGALAPAPSENEARSTLLEERAKIFRLNEAPTSLVSTRWPEAIPHYTLELETLIPQLEKTVDGVILMGNYLGDLGLAKILERASRLPELLK